MTMDRPNKDQVWRHGLLTRLLAGRDLSLSDARKFFSRLFGGQISFQTGKTFLLLLARKGETAEEIAAFSTVGLVGIVAGIVPAWQAYRTDVARDLAEP